MICNVLLNSLTAFHILENMGLKLHLNSRTKKQSLSTGRLGFTLIYLFYLSGLGYSSDGLGHGCLYIMERCKMGQLVRER